MILIFASFFICMRREGGGGKGREEGMEGREGGREGGGRGGGECTVKLRHN